jgi:RimJ/RimL family protein N-acetyltransferase
MSADGGDYAVKAFHARDWSRLAHIRLEALQSYPQFFGASYAEEATYDEKEWCQWLTRPDRCFFGLFHDDALIGMTGVMALQKDPRGETGKMVASYIKPAHQGKGLSSKLFQARLDWSRAYAPWKYLVVAHREGNKKSCRAIQKWGFRLTDKTILSWPDGTRQYEYSYTLNLEDLRRNPLTKTG